MMPDLVGPLIKSLLVVNPGYLITSGTYVCIRHMVRHGKLAITCLTQC